MLPPIRTFFDPKAVWRERMKAVRREAFESRPDAPNHAARIFLETIAVPAATTVSLYYSMGDELDTRPLADALLQRDIAVALPVVEKKRAPLVFRRYRDGDRLVDGAYGEMVPDENAETLIPDILLIPLLGFTRAGDRIGYGGGYYDRTLEALRKTRSPLAVGYAFADQEVDALPVSPLDQRLDWIVTERGAIRC